MEEEVMGRCASMRPEFNSRRSAVVCTRGIVGSSQPLATEAGLRVLRRGGNAADAAVAVAAALAVLEPGSTGIGGDFFALHYDAASREVRCVNGSGKSPKDLDAARVRMDLGLDEGYKGAMPYTPTATHSPHVVTVPGAIAGWLDCIERFGSGKLSFDDLMEDAIRLADEGFPVAPLMARSWKRARDALASVSSNGAEMLVKEDGADGELRAPRAGEVFRRPGLAKVLREVVAKGRDGFYKGWVAEAIVEELHAHGGVMTMEDLAEHATVFPEAISTKYSTVRVWEHPPNGDGLIALIALNILSVLEDQGRVSFESIDYVDPASPISSVKTPACLHAIIEALRIAFADGQRYISDPDKTDFHEYAKQLLSREHAEERASRIDMNKRGTDEDIFGEPKQSSNTVSFNVIDGEGNAVSAVNSNYMGFGSFLVPKGTGFTLQNRGHNFVLDEEHPNNLSKGGVRPFHTIIPCLLTNESDGSLFSSLTNMGGFMQPQAHTQHVINLVKHGFDPQTSCDAPRVRISIDSSGQGAGRVMVEPGISLETIDALRALGHSVDIADPLGGFGRAQVLVRTANGVLWGGSDPRADGCAMGF